MIIALIVLSSILLLLILGLIFKQDFRQDVLKATSENEVEAKGIKIKGALFWVIYALTAVGTIYIALNIEPEKEIIKSKPIIKSVNGNEWVAIDLSEQKPVEIQYGYEDSLLVKKARTSPLLFQYAIDSMLQVSNLKSGYPVGSLDKKSFENLGLIKGLTFEKYVEIRYDLKLNPFHKPKRNTNDFYNWSDYQNLPFSIEIKYTDARDLHTTITAKNEKIQLNIQPHSLTEKWVEITPPINGKIYVIRLRARDIDKTNGPQKPEFANFQILRFSPNN